MANGRLDPTPEDGPHSFPEALTSRKSTEVPAHVKRDVARRKAKEPPAQKFTRDKDELATIEEYHQMMEDRPVKFGPKTSGFVRKGGEKDPQYACLHCVHFYSSPASAHTTCEIVRQSDDLDQVAADDFCMFWSQDGKTFPKLTAGGEEEAAP